METAFQNLKCRMVIISKERERAREISLVIYCQYIVCLESQKAGLLGWTFPNEKGDLKMGKRFRFQTNLKHWTGIDLISLNSNYWIPIESIDALNAISKGQSIGWFWIGLSSLGNFWFREFCVRCRLGVSGTKFRLSIASENQSDQRTWILIRIWSLKNFRV